MPTGIIQGWTRTFPHSAADFSSTVEEPDEDDRDSLLGVYKTNALLRLTPLQRR